MEGQVQYLTQLLSIEQSKMGNLEEKIRLLSKENQRLGEVVRQRKGM